MRRAALTGEAFDGGGHIIHQPLCDSDLFLRRSRMERRLPFYRQQAHLNAKERLPDVIMQRMADGIPPRFLTGKQAVRQSPQGTAAAGAFAELVFIHNRSQWRPRLGESAWDRSWATVIRRPRGAMGCNPTGCLFME